MVAINLGRGHVMMAGVKGGAPLSTSPGVVAGTLGALSTSTGSMLTDALIGSVVGYLVAPRSERLAFAVGGAAATGLAGVIGLLGTTFVGFERRGQ